ncbi:hypothetical protein [Nocardiopsis suaedae]|uniref:XRE family transcriptional regulator n=1 Tax=Nocardiopsis suaedae TaxID=3018444 RepID=A0ABT4TKE5_9ACTN|nr:hypothetical protein [Nocardiopsis suaedae]MDA2805166.1 hypothetical protein [Nocardiopsis suaedae]
MTLWTWVAETSRRLREEGHAETADAVARLPQLAAEGEVGRIRGLLPTALRAARADAGVLPPWTEGYLNHWGAAARVGHRGEGTAALDLVEGALRTAHGEDGDEDEDGGACGPAACAAQNVLDCYANIDGPGRTVDRTALLAEAMTHGGPGLPAWEALVVAHADMLIDDERPDEAVRELDLRAAEIREAGSEVGMEYGFAYVRALRYQERYTDALLTVDRLEEGALQMVPVGVPRSAAARRLRFERARLLAWLARSGLKPPEEAREALPETAEADANPRLRKAWVDAAEDLVSLGELRNDWRVGVALTSWSRYAERVGAHRPCAQMSMAAARLAAARDARWVADCAIRRAQRALVRVRRAQDLENDLEEAHEMVRDVPAVALPTEPEDLLDELRKEPRASVDPERQADLVVAARARRPDDTALLNALGQVGRTLMLSDTAAEPQWHHVRREPGDQKAALSLLETLLHDNDTAGVRTLVRTLTEATPAKA